MTSTDPIQQRVDLLDDAGATGLAAQLKRGIEKESLRIDEIGVLAQTPHPAAIGSALTNPYITTDYSESLLEFVTPAFDSPDKTLDFLEQLHRFAYQNIGSEKLWTSSMPCILLGDKSIPVARYGVSNVGRMKYVYRVGLGYRYGKLMQTIAGIHYNFSLPDALWEQIQRLEPDHVENLRDYRSHGNFRLIRNFHRRCWILLYLMGASPTVCKTFLDGRDHDLESIGEHSFFAPYATTLRMSDLGYQNNAQSGINICYDHVDNYVESLIAATHTPYPPYDEIGVKVNGDYRQLNNNLLQIENEYYTVIRPKRVANSGESPSHALAERGVEYVEVRCLDLDPFLPVGIDTDNARFLDVFLLGCLLDDSPLIDPTEQVMIDSNRQKTVMEGRRPGLMLEFPEGQSLLAEAGHQALTRLRPIAQWLDSAHGNNLHLTALERQMEKFSHPKLTPSARILAEMSTHDESFFRFSMRHAEIHETYFKNSPLSPSCVDMLSRAASRSVEEQSRIEAADTQSFDEFLSRYFADA